MHPTASPAVPRETDDKSPQQHQFAQQRGAMPWLMSSAKCARHGAAVFLRRCHIMQANPQDDPQDSWADMIFAFLSTLVSLVVWACLVMFFGLVYRKIYPASPVDVEKAQEHFKNTDFKHHPFMCHEDAEIACLSFFCGSIRWADTMDSVKLVGSFWL